MFPSHPEVLRSLVAQRHADLLKTAQAVHAHTRQRPWRARWARRLRHAAERLEP